MNMHMEETWKWSDFTSQATCLGQHKHLYSLDVCIFESKGLTACNYIHSEALRTTRASSQDVSKALWVSSWLLRSIFLILYSVDSHKYLRHTMLDPYVHYRHSMTISTYPLCKLMTTPLYSSSTRVMIATQLYTYMHDTMYIACWKTLSVHAFITCTEPRTRFMCNLSVDRVLGQADVNG